MVLHGYQSAGTYNIHFYMWYTVLYLNIQSKLWNHTEF